MLVERGSSKRRNPFPPLARLPSFTSPSAYENYGISLENEVDEVGASLNKPGKVWMKNRLLEKKSGAKLSRSERFVTDPTISYVRCA